MCYDDNLDGIYSIIYRVFFYPYVDCDQVGKQYYVSPSSGIGNLSNLAMLLVLLLPKF